MILLEDVVQLGSLGLPTEDVLVDFAERRFVLQSLQQTLDVLPFHERKKAYYLSKFSVSVAVGLFDAALNFSWDETILALRRLAASIDLSYSHYPTELFVSVRHSKAGCVPLGYNWGLVFRNATREKAT